MEKVRPWCGQPSDRGRLKSRTEQRRRFSCTTADPTVIFMEPNKSKDYELRLRAAS